MDAGLLTLSASGDVQKSVAIEAAGRLPLAALDPFIKDLEDASGNFDLEAKASGPWDNIQWQIDMALDDIGFELPVLEQAVRQLNGKIHLSPRYAMVEGVSGRIEQGRFDLDGRVEMADLRPVRGEIALTLKTLPLQVPNTLDAVVDGNLKLKGELHRSSLEGSLILLEGNYYKNVELSLWSLMTQATQTRRAVSTPEATEYPEWFEGIGLNIDLSYRYPFSVDNNLARLEVAPDLTITGTLAKPILNGRAEVTEGEVLFRGKVFEVKRGVVDFINPYEIEPTFDILSEIRVRQYQITLSITGTPDKLLVKLSSDPYESENDILSLILFGKTNAELTSGQTSGDTTTQQMLANLLINTYGEEVKDTTGLDILELETGSQTAEDSGDRIQVTLGKKIGSRITVKYVVESKNGEMIQRAVSEYRFIEQLLASGFQDSKGKYGGELLFRLEFR
jgi:autotransporter translocation and assembly factor TamB